MRLRRHRHHGQLSLLAPPDLVPDGDAPVLSNRAMPDISVVEPELVPGAAPDPEPDALGDAAVDPASWTLEVIRSKKRKRSVEARLVGGTLRVRVPWWMSQAEIDEAVAKMHKRFADKRRTDRIDLAKRAAALSRQFGLPTATEIRWVGRLTTRWGSCRRDGVIHLSSALATCPTWVVDYVIVHELAHIAHFDHGEQFWALVNRYPRAERAIGYLIARAGMDDISLDDLEAGSG